jgi:8-oxo-dGTP diphosphatase
MTKSEQGKSEIAVVAALLRHPQPSEKVLIVRRGPLETGAGFWEFPGGKVDRGETHAQALAREIEEELGILIKVQELVAENIHAYPEKRIHLFLYAAEILSGEIELREHDAQDWVLPRDLQKEILSEADRPFVDVLKAKLRK